MVELIQDCMFFTEAGETWDVLAGSAEDAAMWDMPEALSINKHKAGHSAFFQSVVLALHYLGLGTPSNIKQCKDILIPLAVLAQIQNDFVDIFDSEKRRKAGADIKENKCTWVIVKAVEIYDGEDLDYLKQHYGTQDEDKVSRILEILRSPPLTTMFKEEQQRWLHDIRAKIESIDESDGLQKSLFNPLVESIVQYGISCLEGH
jgi:farnesyl diphosphate synthase